MNKRVLIIENDQHIREIVEFILKTQGFDTLSMPGPEDVSELENLHADVILLDEFINSRPGHRLCLKIRQVPALAGTPVIVLSTANDIELIAAECRANDYLSKPFDVELLVKKVTHLLDHRPLAC